MLIVAGLYMVLWGKGREMDRPGLDNDKGDEETAAAATVGLGFSGKGGGAVAIASSRVDAISLPVFSTTSPNKRQQQLIHG